MSGPVHLLREGRAVFRVLGEASGVRCIHHCWNLQEHSDMAKVPGFGQALTLTMGFAARGWADSLLFNLTPKCQYICRPFLCGGAFILSSKGSSDLLPRVGLGGGRGLALVLELAGEVGWVGLSPSVWRLLFNAPLFSTVLDPTLYELMSGCLWFSGCLFRALGLCGVGWGASPHRAWAVPALHPRLQSTRGLQHPWFWAPSCRS